jgi:hypothetical protein
MKSEHKKPLEPSCNSDTPTVSDGDCVKNAEVAPKLAPANSDKTEKSIRVVVARHREPLDWLALIPEGHDIYVSNSGEDDPVIPSQVKDRTRVVKVSNGGRECGHWWRYIIANYDQLADIQIFLQGGPDQGHTTDLLFGPWLERSYVEPRMRDSNGFSYIYDQSPFPRKPGGGAYHAHMFICQAHGRKFLPLPSPVGKTDWGGQHFVSREVIQNRPKDFYEGLVQHGCNPEEVSLEAPSATLLKHRTAWIYERAASIIYNVHPD